MFKIVNKKIVVNKDSNEVRDNIKYGIKHEEDGVFIVSIFIM